MGGEQWIGYRWEQEREEKDKVATPRVSPVYIDTLTLVMIQESVHPAGIVWYQSSKWLYL